MSVLFTTGPLDRNLHWACPPTWPRFFATPFGSGTAYMSKSQGPADEGPLVQESPSTTYPGSAEAREDLLDQRQHHRISEQLSQAWLTSALQKAVRSASAKRNSPVDD